MTELEYNEWKTNCPKEWHDTYIDVMYDFIGIDYKDENEIMFITYTEDGCQSYSYGRVSDALVNKNDCCDELIRMRKQSNDFHKKLAK